MERRLCDGKPPMTRDKFMAYMGHLAGLLNLSHWRLEMAPEPPRDGAWASVVCWETQYGAAVRVSDNLLAETEDNVRRCVIHELIHCWLSHADHLAGKDLGGRPYRDWQAANEYATDGLSHAISQFLPLPGEFFASKTPKTAEKPVKKAKNKGKTP